MTHLPAAKDANPNELEYLAYAVTEGSSHCSTSVGPAYSRAVGEMQHTQVRNTAPFFQTPISSHRGAVISHKDLATLVNVNLSPSVPGGNCHALHNEYAATSAPIQISSVQQPMIISSTSLSGSYSSVYVQEKTDNCMLGSAFELQKVQNKSTDGTFSENIVHFDGSQKANTKVVVSMPRNNQSMLVPYSVPNQLDCQGTQIQWTPSLPGASGQLITPGVVFPHCQISGASSVSGSSAPQVYTAKHVIPASGQLISINSKPNVQLHGLTSDESSCIEENTNVELADQQLNTINYVPPSVYQFGGGCYTYPLQKKSTEEGASNSQADMPGQPESLVLYSPDFQAYGKTVLVKSSKNVHQVTEGNGCTAEKSQSSINVLSSSGSEFDPKVAATTSISVNSLPLSYSFAQPVSSKPDTVLICEGHPNSMVIESNPSKGVLTDGKPSHSLVLGLATPYIPVETSSTPIAAVTNGSTVTRATNRPLIARGATTSSNECSSTKTSTAVTSLAGDSAAFPASSKCSTKAGQTVHTCEVCSETFTSLYLFKRHLKTHGPEKRGSLNMKSKIEIIKRSKAGERLTDLALEYNAGKSTLITIVKNSEMYLKLQEGGQLCAERKRLRKAVKEDVEEAVYLWYKQVTEMNIPISGPKLCSKAKEFALKLGHKDFKASNGWLDRFKHRKSVQIPRNVKPLKTTLAGYELPDLDANPQDFDSVVLPTLLLEHNARDVFFADEFGIFFSALPNDCVDVSCVRCCNGGLSSKRLTVLACCNMNGSEKLPLVVIGRYKAPNMDELSCKLHLQYHFNSKAWMTADCFKNWLLEMDAAFDQKNRKVLLLLPTSPVHPSDIGLRAIKVVSTPSTFKGPVKLGISKSIKQQYRRSVIELILDSLDSRSGKPERSESVSHVSMVQALHFLARSWQNLPTAAISSSFLRAGFNKYSPWAVNDVCNISLAADNLELLHSLKENGFKIEPHLTFNDFVSFDDNVQVCHVMDDDAIVSMVTAKVQAFEESDTELEDVGRPLPLTIPRSKLEIKSNSARPTSSEKATSIQKNSLLSSLQFIRSHVQKRVAKCPELGSVFNELHSLIESSLVEMSANDRVS